MKNALKDCMAGKMVQKKISELEDLATENIQNQAEKKLQKEHQGSVTQHLEGKIHQRGKTVYWVQYMVTG